MPKRDWINEGYVVRTDSDTDEVYNPRTDEWLPPGHPRAPARKSPPPRGLHLQPPIRKAHTMSIINVIVLPADKDQPVRRETYDTTDYRNLTALIFNGDRDGVFDRLSLNDSGDEVTMWFDDNGLARLDNEEVADCINLRAMQLYAHLAGAAGLEDFMVPLIGDYVITGGADDEGNNLDAPGWIADFPFDWQSRYVIRRVEVEDE